MTSQQHSIVVGLDGSRAAWRSLDWVADDAQRTGRSVLIVHVAHLDAEREPVDPNGAARQLLDKADRRFAERYSDVIVRTALLAGDPADVLVELSHSADLVVVGRGPQSLPHRLLGSVANKVLAHAVCPVVILPQERGAARNLIAVGVSDSSGGEAALEFAFAEAARRDAELVAVRSWSTHEWKLAAGAAFPLSSPELWESQERTVLDDCLRPVRDSYPSVRVHPVLSSAPTEVILERESQTAAMLVLGCRRSADALLPRLGPISSWAAHHFECPVVIVGNPEDRLAGQVAADAARVSVPHREGDKP
jgi:nucleotide-binding universal stress UspA family protein